jgi:hypothetical protein
MDHRVARVPTNPATIAVTYTDRSQEANVRDIILSGMFVRCLGELGMCTQSGLIIIADCRSNQRDSYVLSEEHYRTAY